MIINRQPRTEAATSGTPADLHHGTELIDDCITAIDRVLAENKTLLDQEPAG